MIKKQKEDWKKVESHHWKPFIEEMDFYYNNWISDLLSRKHITAEGREAIFNKMNLLMEE
jgi:hypothetical protein